MSDYYKSLISDEEVVAALLKDCEKREESNIINKPRLKPNLNFFQRTVSNLVSVNKRIDRRTTVFKKTSNVTSSSTSKAGTTSNKNGHNAEKARSISKLDQDDIIIYDDHKTRLNPKKRNRSKTDSSCQEMKSIVISSSTSSSSSCLSDCSCSSSSSNSSEDEKEKYYTKRAKFKKQKLLDTSVIVVNSSTDSD